MNKIVAGLLVLILGYGDSSAQDTKDPSKFAFDLYAQVVKANEGGNVFLSPAEVSQALARKDDQANSNFQSYWNLRVDKKWTIGLPFHFADGATRNHPLMNLWGDFRFVETKLWKAVRLPCGKKDETAMYLFVPNEGRTLADLHASVTTDGFEQAIRTMKVAHCGIQLPRVSLKCEADLSRPLGVRFAHRTGLELNEENAAAHGDAPRDINKQGPNEATMIVADRPFFFVIRDDTTGAILFLGSIVDPR